MLWSDALFHRPAWNPFRELARLHSPLDPFWRHARLPEAGPAERSELNVWSREDAVMVALLAPGVAARDIDLSVEGDSLTIQGSRSIAEPKSPQAVENDRPAVTPLKQERPSGAFTRTVTLPFPVQAEDVKARMSMGILWIEMPRAVEDRPRKIAVRAETE